MSSTRSPSRTRTTRTRRATSARARARSARRRAPSAWATTLTLVKPGARSNPYHFHHAEEEAFYILEGHATLRQGAEGGEEERIEVGPGDIVAFPAGTGISHQFINTSDAPFVYLAISTIEPLDVAEYPDSDKVNVRSTRLIVRRSPRLDYLDGEV